MYETVENQTCNKKIGKNVFSVSLGMILLIRTLLVLISVKLNFNTAHTYIHHVRQMHRHKAALIE